MMGYEIPLIDNNNLIPHLERHERELSVLYSIARILGAPSGQKEMLVEVLDIIETQLEMQRGTILLLSSDGSELVVEAAKNIRTPEKKKRALSAGRRHRQARASNRKIGNRSKNIPGTRIPRSDSSP
ncbi:MAG: hypothetical protein AB1656_12465 [Candidatus Omnitrophota bacterium]